MSVPWIVSLRWLMREELFVLNRSIISWKPASHWLMWSNLSPICKRFCIIAWLHAWSRAEILATLSWMSLLRTWGFKTITECFSTVQFDDVLLRHVKHQFNLLKKKLTLNKIKNNVQWWFLEHTGHLHNVKVFPISRDTAYRRLLGNYQLHQYSLLGSDKLGMKSASLFHYERSS